MTEFHPSYLLNAIAYAAAGIVTFLIAFAALGRIVPYPLWKEIVENKNVALAILIGAISIGMCTIIAAAMH